MSQQNPQAAKFINIMLIAVLVYLGFTLFLGSQGPQDSRTAAQVLASIREHAAALRDVSANTDLNQYLRKVQDEGKRQQQKPDEIARREMEGLMLVMDAKIKSAVYRRQVDKTNATFAFPKLDRAYLTFHPKYEALRGQPIWKESFSVTPAPRLGAEFAAASATPEQIYNSIVRELSAESKTHLVYGLFRGYDFIDFFVKLTGSNPGFSYWFAAFLIALIVRLIILPLAHKQIMWSRNMSQLGPYMQEIKDKFTDKKGQISDQQAYTQETMKLYKEYGINPVAGCGPMLIQLPFFLTVYQCMLHYKFEFTKGSFLWIHPGATSFFGIPLAPNLGERDYILIFIYGVSMVIATLLQPITVSDPAQAKQQRLLGIGIAVFFSIIMFFWPLPSAFVVYWTFANIFSTTQSLITYRIPIPPLKKVVSVKGGALPVDEAANGKVSVDKFFGNAGAPKNVRPKKKKG